VKVAKKVVLTCLRWENCKGVRGCSDRAKKAGIAPYSGKGQKRLVLRRERGREINGRKLRSMTKLEKVLRGGHESPCMPWPKGEKDASIRLIGVSQLKVLW